jgi:hypothetical protein
MVKIVEITVRDWRENENGKAHQRRHQYHHARIKRRPDLRAYVATPLSSIPM